MLEPLGTVFLNLMFCIAVPTVFCSVSSAIANMQSATAGRQDHGHDGPDLLRHRRRRGSHHVRRWSGPSPWCPTGYQLDGGARVGGTLGLSDMIINFFTKPDFSELWSRKAILPLIVAAVLFGFGIQLAGGPADEDGRAAGGCHRAAS